MSNLDVFVTELKEQSFTKNLYGKEYQVINSTQEGNLSFKYYKLLDKKVANSLREIHILALKNGVVPIRYLENIFYFGIENQIKLLESKVAICGLGKVGSEIAENLARLGVGEITLIDSDLLKEEDLNSQKTALPEYLMLPRNTVVHMRIRDINAAIRINEYSESLSTGYFKEAIEGCNLVIQTDDSNLSAFEAYSLSIKTGIPFLFAVLEGLHGKVITIQPAGLSESKKDLMKEFLFEIKKSTIPTLPHKLSVFAGNVVTEVMASLLEGINKSNNAILYA